MWAAKYSRRKVSSASSVPFSVMITGTPNFSDHSIASKKSCGVLAIIPFDDEADAGRSGVVVYLRGHEGRGIGLVNKLRAYELQDEGEDTVEANLHLGFKADPRDYGTGAQILVDLGARRLRLMTNNPKKIVGLEGYGIEVIDRVPIEMEAGEEDKGYLLCKRDRMGHVIQVK